MPTKKPVFARGSNNNEFWVPIIEKAYAKFYQSYQNSTKSSIHTALVDLTGGILSSIEIYADEYKNKESKLFDKIVAATQNESIIIGVSIVSDNLPPGLLYKGSGLITQYTYGKSGQ